MSRDIFVSSDPHFSHERILTFTDRDGRRIRPQFSNVDEMNEHIIERHNSVVRPTDKWYCLGDLMFGSLGSFDAIVPRLNGRGRLVLGNHDYAHRWAYEKYFTYFEKVMESRRMGEVLLSHRPVLLGDSDTRVKSNVHGHIHDQYVMDRRWPAKRDARYVNVSMEAIDYTPVSLEEIRDRLKSDGIEVDFKLE